MRVFCLSDQGLSTFLKELIKDAKNQIRNGFILSLIGLFFAGLGFFSFAIDLMRFNPGWLALGEAGAAMVIVGFYIMIRSDLQEAKWTRELGNITSQTQKSPEPSKSSESPQSTGGIDVYFDENSEDWKNPFEEDEKQTPTH